MKTVFLGKSGITATEAAHIKNMAKELAADDLANLNGLNFVTGIAEVIGNSQPIVVQQGITDESFVIPSLQRIAMNYALSSWLGEGIKAKNALLDSIPTRLDDYLQLKGYDLKFPERESVPSEEEVLLTHNPDFLVKYYGLEAKAAHYGKMVHPNGPISVARAKANKVKNEPNIVKGEGRDTTVFRYTVDLGTDKVQDLFFNVQNLHRQAQQELNQMKSLIKKEQSELATASAKRFAERVDEYQTQRAKYEAEYLEYCEKEKSRISALRIVIPKDLSEIYNYVKERVVQS